MSETVKMPENWPEVLESRAAAAHLGDTSGTIDLLRMTADFIRSTRSDPAVRDRVTDEAAHLIHGGVEESILSRFSVFRDMEPEEDESWESWYFAAFDMLREEVRSILSALESRTSPVMDMVTDERVEAAAEIVWNDLFGSRGGPWDNPPVDSISGIQIRATARATLTAALRTSPPEPALGTFQERVAAAHVALFHDDPTDLAERRDRFGEESNELQQALGQTREAAHQLVDYTYDREVGEPEKEIGASALTLASLCVIGGFDMMACAEADLSALQTPEKIAKVRAKRATRHGRGPLPGLSPAKEPQ